MKKYFFYILLLTSLISCSKDELNILPPDLDWEINIFESYNDNSGNYINFNNIPDNIYALESTSDNGFILAINGNIQKYNSDGDSIWQKSYSEPIEAIKNIENDDHLLYSSSSDSFWIAKTNSNWELTWEKSILFEANSSPFIQSITKGNDGYYIAIRISNNPYSHSRLYKFDFNGNLIWQNKFPDLELASISAVEIGNDGFLYIAGGASTNSSRAAKPWFAKIGDNGRIVENYFLEDEENDFITGIQERTNGDFILVRSKLNYYSEIIIVNKEGEVKYQNETGGINTGNSRFWSFEETQHGEWLLSGEYFFNNSVFAKVDENGHRTWQIILNNSSNFIYKFSIASCQLTDESYVFLTKSNNDPDYYYSIHKTMPQ